MPLTLDDFNGMELMWKQLDKKPDKGHVTMSMEDVDSMWYCGIVDTRRFSIEKWRAAFDGHRQVDGTYLLDKEEFLEKEVYRYKGEILVPFDAMMINEGKYTDEGLSELFDLSVKPSCSLSAMELKKFMEDLKSKFREKFGLIKIDKPAKIMIRELLEKHPSPLRRLELIFDHLIQQEQIEEAKGIKRPEAVIPGRLTQEQIAKIQVSSFSTLPLTETEKRYKVLSKLQKIKGKTVKAEETGTPLKKVKRSRKGIRG